MKSCQMEVTLEGFLSQQWPPAAVAPGSSPYLTMCHTCEGGAHDSQAGAEVGSLGAVSFWGLDKRGWEMHSCLTLCNSLAL